MPITTNHYLYLSGTPFKALTSGEFIEEQIYNWTYSDEQKEKVLIATKAGLKRPGGTGWTTHGNPDHIKEAIKGSLERLGVDKIELYMLHAVDPEVPLMGSLKAFKEEKKE